MSEILSKERWESSNVFSSPLFVTIPYFIYSFSLSSVSFGLIEFSSVKSFPIFNFWIILNKYF